MLAFTLSACGDDITEIQRPEGWGVDVGDEENVYGDIVIKDESEPMVHPGCLHSADDLARAKEKVAAGEAPWIDGWNKLMENALNMDLKGGNITLKAKTKLELSAGSTTVTLESGGNLGLKSDKEITAETATLTEKGSAQVSVQGAKVEVKATGTMDLQATGIATLKGTMVNIN